MINQNNRELLQTAVALRTPEQQQAFMASLTQEEREAMAAEAKAVLERVGMVFRDAAKQIVEGWRCAWESLPQQTRCELQRAAQEKEGGAT